MGGGHILELLGGGGSRNRKEGLDVIEMGGGGGSLLIPNTFYSLLIPITFYSLLCPKGIFTSAMSQKMVKIENILHRNFVNVAIKLELYRLIV